METDITTNNKGDVVYTMPRKTAIALGNLLRKTGYEQKDQGWGQDGENLIAVALKAHPAVFTLGDTNTAVFTPGDTK